MANPLTSAVIANGVPKAADLLGCRGAEQKRLHGRAAEAAKTHFGPRVFMRGVVELSNFCRENCVYCGMRRENRSLDRFRARLEDLSELLVHHRPSSITDLNIQTGEDPVAVREIVIPLIRRLREQTQLGISVCLGTLTPSMYDELFNSGASIYIMKFEIADEAAYRRMSAPGSLNERLEHIELLARKGWRVSSGFIAGLPGQTHDDVVKNLELAEKLPLVGCSVSPFIPGEATPLHDSPTGDLELTLNSMAVMRLMRPDWVIPAVSALNLAGPGSGYNRGLRTGANLVTMNLTPSDLRDDYLLYKRDRFIMTEEKILEALESEKLAPSEQSLADYYVAREEKTVTAALA